MQTIQALKLYGIPDDNKVIVTAAQPSRLSYFAEGNGNIPDDFPVPGIRMTTLYLGGIKPQLPLPLRRLPSVIINGVADPEINWKALRRAYQLERSAGKRGVAVINSPEAVSHTLREEVSERLQGIDRLRVPRVWRESALTIGRLLARLDSGELTFPFLIRDVDGRGLGWVGIYGPRQMAKLRLLAFDGRDYQLAPFHRYRSRDGLFRRFRMVKIGERMFPRFLLFGDHWRVRAEARARIMGEREDLQEAERTFLADPFGLLGRELIEVIKEGLDRVALDIAAMDFTIDPQDGLLMFQCDACFDAFSTDGEPPYIGDTVEEMREALGALIRARAEAQPIESGG